MKNLCFLGFSKYAVSRDGEIYSFYSNRFLKKYLKKDGYYQVGLYDDFKEKKDLRVSRLVALAFLENDHLYDQVNHKDGNKLNNHYMNLEWCNQSQNTLHSFRDGLQRTANNNRVTELAVVHTICKLIEDGFRNKDISECLNVHCNTISAIKHKQRWVQISCEYDLSKVSSSHRLSENKVRKICKFLSEGNSCSKTALKFNISKKTVVNIFKRKTYKTFSDSYNW